MFSERTYTTQEVNDAIKIMNLFYAKLLNLSREHNCEFDIAREVAALRQGTAPFEEVFTRVSNMLQLKNYDEKKIACVHARTLASNHF
jgi:hypothetical protein